MTETGRLRLPDGREMGSLSGAVSEFSGKSVDGWYAWRTADTGELLHSLRQQLLEQAVREVPDDGYSDLEAGQDEFVQSAKKAAESGSPLQPGEPISRCLPRIGDRSSHQSVARQRHQATNVHPVPLHTSDLTIARLSPARHRARQHPSPW